MVKKRNKKHPWDETMVIIVMVVSALCILFMLASYVTVTGKAAAQPTQSGVLEMLNKATIIEGSGKGSCRVKCNDQELVCILAHKNGILVDCGDKKPATYHCLCTNV